MYRTGGVVSLLGAVALFAGCQPAAETAEQAEARMASETAAARSAIEASNVRFMAHFNAGQGTRWPRTTPRTAGSWRPTCRSRPGVRPSPRRWE